MNEQWNELKSIITDMRDNYGTGTQREVCGFLVKLMNKLEKQMSSSEEPNDLQENGGGTMTLDEAIKHCEEVAEKNESEANFGFGNVCIDRSSCLECAKEHRQLAAWLKELKAYRNKPQERDNESCDDI